MPDVILKVKEARYFLSRHGIDWTEVWIRRQMGQGKIKTERQLNSVGIKTSELLRIIKERK